MPFGVGVTGLAAATEYDLKVVVDKPFIGSVADTKTFTTLPDSPAIYSFSSFNVTADSADLRAQINPRGDDTTYRFEYGTTAQYGQSAPIPDQDIGSGSDPVSVEHPPDGPPGRDLSLPRRRS